MKKNIRILAVIFTFAVLLGCFAGCSAAPKAENSLSAERYDSVYDGVYDSMEMENVQLEGKVEAPSAGEAASSVMAQKLIRTMSLEVETEALDNLLAALETKIQALGGYVENRNVRNGGTYNNRTYRYANLTVRIPVEELDGFVEHVKGASNVLTHQESAEDVTLKYVATKSRITALETEQQRLLELLAKAENMSDLLMIEERLTNVRAELEQVTSQLRLYDNLVDYGTVKLSITEVQEFTVVEEEQTVWQRIGEGFMNSLKGVGIAIREIFVFVIVSAPYLVLIAAAVAVTVLLCKKHRRKKAEKRAAKRQLPPQE